MEHDPYSVLGLPADASLEEARRAWRKLAMRWHPDRNTSAEAEERFKHIQAAFALVSDPQRLAEWRAVRAARVRGEAEYVLELTLEEAALGGRKDISIPVEAECESCAGEGVERLAQSIPCPVCQGVGRVRAPNRRTATCAECAGRGYVRRRACRQCSGAGRALRSRQLALQVPPGTQAGDRLRLRGQAGQEDVFLRIGLAPHELFTLDGRDLHCRVPVSIYAALAGASLDVPTLRGRSRIELAPARAASWDQRLPGMGFPGRNGNGAGDLVLHLHAVFPDPPGDSERAALRALDAGLARELPRRAPELDRWQRRLAEREGGTGP